MRRTTSTSLRENLQASAASSTGRSTEAIERPSMMPTAPLPDQPALLPRGENRAQEPGDQAPLPETQTGSTTVPMSSTSRPQNAQPGNDCLREWNEIEGEERLVAAELTHAPPGHPLLGPVHSQLNEYETVDLPFLVITSRSGTVYHCHWDCRYLTAPATGARKNRRWCLECRREAVQSGVFPSHGAAMFISSWESDAHSNPMCERAEGSKTFSLCTACLDVNM